MLSEEAVESMRQRLVHAALSIYRQHGLAAVSFRRIAERCGVSHTLVYRYFEDKEALLAQVRVHCFAEFEAFVRAREAEHGGMARHIHSVAQAYAGYARAHTADYLLMFSTEQPQPDRYPELLSARQSLFEHAVDIVRRYVDSGELGGDARLIAHSLWITLHGLMTLYAANQLVHGCSFDELITPVIDRLIAGGAV